MGSVVVKSALRKFVTFAIAAGVGLVPMEGYADEATNTEPAEIPAALERRIVEIRDRLALTDKTERGGGSDPEGRTCETGVHLGEARDRSDSRRGASAPRIAGRAPTAK